MRKSNSIKYVYFSLWLHEATETANVGGLADILNSIQTLYNKIQFETWRVLRIIYLWLESRQKLIVFHAYTEANSGFVVVKLSKRHLLIEFLVHVFEIDQVETVHLFIISLIGSSELKIRFLLSVVDNSI